MVILNPFYKSLSNYCCRISITHVLSRWICQVLHLFAKRGKILLFGIYFKQDIVTLWTFHWKKNNNSINSLFTHFHIYISRAKHICFTYDKLKDLSPSSLTFELPPLSLIILFTLLLPGFFGHKSHIRKLPGFSENNQLNQWSLLFPNVWKRQYLCYAFKNRNTYVIVVIKLVKRYHLTFNLRFL